MAGVFFLVFISLLTSLGCKNIFEEKENGKTKQKKLTKVEFLNLIQLIITKDNYIILFDEGSNSFYKPRSIVRIYDSNKYLLHEKELPIHSMRLLESRILWGDLYKEFNKSKNIKIENYLIILDDRYNGKGYISKCNVVITSFILNKLNYTVEFKGLKTDNENICQNWWADKNIAPKNYLEEFSKDTIFNLQINDIILQEDNPLHISTKEFSNNADYIYSNSFYFLDGELRKKFNEDIWELISN